jgi:glucose/mannose transport system permease protein
MTVIPAATASGSPTAPVLPARRRRNRDQWTAIAVILPSILATAIFVYGFIGWTLRVSLSNWTGLMPDYTFAGLRQYLDLARDPRFAIDIRNTAIFTVLFLVSCLAIGLFLAILLDQRLRGENIFRSIFLFPMAVSFIVTGVAWRWLMNSATGTRISGLNLLFHQLGLDPLINNWHLTDPPWGIAFIALPAVWQMSGFTMALYLGGLRAISDDLREAARVDGASEFQTYRYILLPLLRPITLSAVIILGHISLKIFDLIVAISQNNIALDVPAVYMWRTTFDGNNYGRGAAIGILMLITVAVLIVPYLVYSMRSEAEL